MLTKISIEGIKSYKKKENIELETINFFYGYNGSGKTTLGRCIRDYKKKLDGVSVEGNVDKILTYNSDFIKDNFFETNKLKGIFYLGKENIDIYNLIKTNIELKNKNIEKKIQLENTIDENKCKAKQIKDNLIDLFWNNRKFSEKKEEDFLMSITKGFNNDKKKWGIEVNKHLEKFKKENCNFKNSDELLKEYSILYSDDNQEKLFINSIYPILKEKNEIEKNKIFEEVITGNKDNPLNDMISSLSNSSWVSDGIKYVENEKNICPFCQQKLEKGFLNNIKLYFDESYKKKLIDLNELLKHYTDLEEKIESEYIKFKYIGDVKIKFQQNIELIIKKIKEPNRKIYLMNFSIEKLESYIEDENKKIREYNKKIKEKKYRRTNYENEVWNYFLFKLNKTLYKTLIKNLNLINEEIESNKRLIEDQINNIKSLTLNISENRAKISNLVTAKDNINCQLRLSGINSFKIELGEEKSYHIVRPDKEEGDFFSLSEGEKTLLTFLYFCEICKADKTDKLVIIDDPVSSLDNNNLFNIAYLIKDNFIKVTNRKSTIKNKIKNVIKYTSINASQIIFMTHNLFFLEEMLHELKNSNYDGLKIFKVIKQDTTRIEEKLKKDIQTDYETCWEVIKQVPSFSDNINKSLIIISARKILENYFKFVCAEDSLHSAINKIIKENNDLKIFERFLNRNSHKDFLSDYYDLNDVDFSNFNNYLKLIFEETGNISHYNKMMGIN